MNQADEWLKKFTGDGAASWVQLIQDEITAATTDSNTDVRAWLTRFCAVVDSKIPADRPDFDENVRASGIAGLALVLWHLRVRRAKCYDPRRAVGARRNAFRERQAFIHALLDAIVDEELDHEFFKGQEWEPPFQNEA